MDQHRKFWRLSHAKAPIQASTHRSLQFGPYITSIAPKPKAYNVKMYRSLKYGPFIVPTATQSNAHNVNDSVSFLFEAIYMYM